MAITKRIISDAVLFRLAEGFPNVQGSVQKQDIYFAMEQKINAKFRMRQFQNLQAGETIPDGLNMATYESIAVTSSGNISKSILPVMPVSLIRNMGIFDIRNDGNSFIPLMPGQTNLLRVDSLLNSLLNQVAYEPKGTTIYYNTDITLLGYTTVDMDLIVTDVLSLSETDLLPIPADYGDELVNELFAQFSPQPTSLKETNPLAK